MTHNSCRSCLLAALVLAAVGTADAAPVAPPEMPPVWKTPARKVRAATVSLDGKFVAILDTEDRVGVTLYDRRTGTGVLRIPQCGPDLLAFTPDSKRLLTKWYLHPKDEAVRCEVRVWDLATGRRIRGIELLPSHNIGPGQLYGVSNDVLVVVGADRLITAYNLTNGKRLGDFANREHRPKLLALSQDGKWLMTSGEKNELCVWDVAKRQLFAKLGEHASKVRAIAISADGAWCASTAKGKLTPLLFVFDRQKGTEHARADLLAAGMTGLYFSSDGGTLFATGIGSNHGLNVWDWKKSKEIRGGLPPRGAVAYLVDPDDEKWKKGTLRGCGMTSAGELLTLEKNDLRVWFDKTPREFVDPEPPKKAKPKPKPKK